MVRQGQYGSVLSGSVVIDFHTGHAGLYGEYPFMHQRWIYAAGILYVSEVFSGIIEKGIKQIGVLVLCKFSDNFSTHPLTVLTKDVIL